MRKDNISASLASFKTDLNQPITTGVVLSIGQLLSNNTFTFKILLEIELC